MCCISLIMLIEWPDGQEYEIAKAHANIIGDGIYGTADFFEMQLGTATWVRVLVRINSEQGVLKPGLHGCHLHEKGICEVPFMTAGGHFDLGPAANNDPDVNHPFHMGDLPNIEIKEDGSGQLNAITTRFSIMDGPICIFNEGGASIMIHGNHDQCVSGPHKSGVSGGPRSGCGVILKI